MKKCNIVYTVHINDLEEVEEWLIAHDESLAGLLEACCHEANTGDNLGVLWLVRNQTDDRWWVDRQLTDEDAADGIKLVYGPVGYVAEQSDFEVA